MDQYTVTYVSAPGASTWSFNDETRALSRYGLLKADPSIVYGHMTVNGEITKQFVRTAGSIETQDLLS